MELEVRINLLFEQLFELPEEMEINELAYENFKQKHNEMTIESKLFTTKETLKPDNVWILNIKDILKTMLE